MEVVHRHEEEEEVEEQLLPRRRRRADLSDPRDDDGSESLDDTMIGGYEVSQAVVSDENTVYFDDQKESENHEEITKIVTVSVGENVTTDESDDEEVIELEFGSAVDKLHTHTPYCPNCSSKIRKVILRRKIRARPRPGEPGDLLGCLSFFKILIPSGNCLNPFVLFKSKPKVESLKFEDEQPLISTEDTTANAGDHTELQRSKINPHQMEISKVVHGTINRQQIVNFTAENMIVEESDDEEVIELEFERAVDKVHTHTPYCSNCSNQITKVILRRKKKASPRPDKPLDLLGCLSCFSIFIPSGDCLNPFRLFKSKPKLESHEIEDGQPPISLGGTTDNAGEAVGGRPNLQQPLISEIFGGRPPLQKPLISEAVGGRPPLQQPLIRQKTGIWNGLNPFHFFGASSTTTNAAGTVERPNPFTSFGNSTQIHEEARPDIPTYSRGDIKDVPGIFWNKPNLLVPILLHMIYSYYLREGSL